MTHNVTDGSLSIDPDRLQAKVTSLIRSEVGRLLFITDGDGIVTSCQASILDEFDIPYSDLLGRDVDTLITKTDNGAEEDFDEYRIFHGSLNGKTFKFKASEVLTVDGPGTAYFVILKRVEDLAQDYIEKAEESKILFENSPLAMCLVDAKMRANVVNDAARELLAINPDKDITDGKYGELVGCYNSTYGKGCGTNRPCKDCVIRNTVNATFKDRLPREKVEGDFTVCRDGSIEVRRIQIWTRLILNRNKVLLALNDITDVKTVERSLLEANKKLNLLSSITRHDTLNSLTTLSLLVELASDGEGLDDVTASYLNRMRGIVKDIDRQINFTKTYQDLGSQQPIWHQLGNTLRDSMPDDMPLELVLYESVEKIEVLADPMLPRVFHNLMENVVRHGKRATRIEVSIQSNDDVISILFKDDGLGVPDDDKQSIFDRGFGSNNGLGLFLSKEILSLTDLGFFEIGVYGDGACFQVVVPSTKCRISA